MNKEIILDILEIENKAIGNSRYTYDGFLIKTDKQEIFVGISNSQHCCENWGYLSTLDDTNEFIGAELFDVLEVDEELRATKTNFNVEEGGLFFINFETNRGTFQLTCYNAHNGYYGHDAVVVSDKFNYSETL